MSQGEFRGRIRSGLTMAGIALAAPLALSLTAASAAAQQAVYYPAAGNSAVTVNYGALTPYGAPGYQPYAGQPVMGQPQSVFTPQGAQPAYGQPVYGQSAPSSQFLPGAAAPVAPIAVPVQAAPVALAGPGYSGRAYSPITYTASPIQAPFVAPYANPALQQPQMTRAGLPSSTPQSYLNVPGQAPVALMGTPQAGAKPFDPNSLKRKAKKQAPAPSAVEEAAAAQVAAVEEQLESGAAPAAALPEPTPPEAPADVPASVPSPVQEAAVAPAAPAAPEAPAAAAPATETPAAETPATETPAAETPAAEAPAAETPAEEEATADAGGAAALPGGATRIVFEGEADELPAGADAQLDAIAQKMTADESIKVQVLAYSSSTGDNESQARRKALARGLEVRKYLINKGVRSNRIDVRALGSKSEGSPADRVDVVPAAG